MMQLGRAPDPETRQGLWPVQINSGDCHNYNNTPVDVGDGCGIAVSIVPRQAWRNPAEERTADQRVVVPAIGRVAGVALITFVSPENKNHKSLVIRYDNSKVKQAVGEGKEGARRKCIWEKGNPRSKNPSWLVAWTCQVVARYRQLVQPGCMLAVSKARPQTSGVGCSCVGVDVGSAIFWRYSAALSKIFSSRDELNVERTKKKKKYVVVGAYHCRPRRGASGSPSQPAHQQQSAATSLRTVTGQSRTRWLQGQNVAILH
ncbi:hypothetical protein I7I51_02914 [Histoplasma capsulatum]|uniref:Uncharacterized protein n=1 Tax=Ajellomyces capsulatus TaxID=5037 RepID=A0A8A1MLK3_AJECA|nr:hypothetical protein I7I51_02914 [Histoplasma capsulatum]